MNPCSSAFPSPVQWKHQPLCWSPSLPNRSQGRHAENLSHTEDITHIGRGGSIYTPDRSKLDLSSCRLQRVKVAEKMRIQIKLESFMSNHQAVTHTETEGKSLSTSSQPFGSLAKKSLSSSVNGDILTHASVISLLPYSST